ncbi:hypothetical protein RB653_004801 [Dictyostelium firmibasis]|uniref:EF-hand domain-containing protein n=1 Tax=Dictyostelium firmibasis TaxID=79012 RepID=A0AAN7U8C9_9MYCE
MLLTSKNIVEQVQSMLDTYDTNKDGEITKSEAVEYFKSKKAFNPERSAMALFRVYDKDNDNKITIKELAGDIDFEKALKEYQENQEKEKEVDLDVEAFILKFDIDDNKKVSKEEAIAIFAETGAKDPNKSANFIFEEMDSDKDGVITLNEMRSYYKKVQELLGPQQ